MKIEDGRYSLVVYGTLRIERDNEAKFTGKLTKGSRPVLWYDNKETSTSIQIMDNITIRPGDSTQSEICILSPWYFKGQLSIGTIFNFGYPGRKIGEFTVSEVRRYLKPTEKL